MTSVFEEQLLGKIKLVGRWMDNEVSDSETFCKACEFMCRRNNMPGDGNGLCLVVIAWLQI